MIRITPKLYEAIQKVVTSGRYDSIESFSEIAIKNQLILENDEPEQEMRSYEKYAPPIVREQSFSKIIPVKSIRQTDERRLKPIWGLINRFAPAKLVLRCLVSELLKQNEEWADLTKFKSEAVSMANEIRSKIENNTDTKLAVRGEGIETGFPQRDVKSQQRFIDSYIGKLRSDNRMDGLLGELELASIKKEASGQLKIGITEAGLEFASQISCFLDNEKKNYSSAFYPEERDFLIGHIKRIKPGEFNFLNFLLLSVIDRIDTPEKLTSTLRLYADQNGWKNAEGKDITDAALNTYKVGGVGRLVELRILRIQKDGIRTRYYVEENVKNLDSIITKRAV